MGGYPAGPFQTVLDRHQLLLLGGKVFLLVGLFSAGWVLYEWYLFSTSHIVIAVVAGFSILIGTQLLIFAGMTSMLITLFYESRSSE